MQIRHPIYSFYLIKEGTKLVRPKEILFLPKIMYTRKIETIQLGHTSLMNYKYYFIIIQGFIIIKYKNSYRTHYLKYLEAK